MLSVWVFANDLLDLKLATPALNRYDKADRDPGEWLPGCNRSWFAYREVELKVKYGVTVDVLEAAALGEVLRLCDRDAARRAVRRREC